MLIALPNAFGDAATNMAIDASLLDSLPRQTAAFRHYGWVEPSMSFGYAQPYAAVAATAPPGLRLVRRLTGGGLVDHRNDWTYALVLHAKIPATRMPATELYERVHRCIAEALEDQGTPSQLAPCPRNCPSSHPTFRFPNPEPRIPDLAVCFTQPAANDVLRPDGRKIAGAAMKRNRAGLLLQGSLDRAALPASFDAEAFREKFLHQLADCLQLPREQPEDLRNLFDGATIQHERERFHSQAWNERR